MYDMPVPSSAFKRINLLEVSVCLAFPSLADSFDEVSINLPHVFQQFSGKQCAPMIQVARLELDTTYDPL
jgi:hypothetical protein